MNSAQNTGGATTKKGNYFGYTVDEIIDKDILVLLGAENMSPEDKSRIYQKMMQTIQTRVIARINDQLSDEDAAKLRDVAMTGDEQLFHDFFKEKNVDLAKLFTQEALAYKFELIELMKSTEA